MGANQFDMPYAEKIPAMLHAWYGGSESGTALAQVLFGEVNPSGKLPVTFYRQLNDCGAIAMGEYPGDGKNVRYNEGIFVGYRYVDKFDVKPQFHFGHGLSYTKFRYGKPIADRMKIHSGDTIKISVPVTNVGNRSGKEVVQLYVHDEKASVPRPVKELKGFVKLDLAPGETKNAVFSISSRDLSFYDEASQCWKAEPGGFKLMIGASSSDIKCNLSITLM